MSDPSLYAGLRNVVKLDMRTTDTCLVCKEPRFGAADLAVAINHYIHDHDFRVLHIGTETSQATGAMAHTTVAVLGR